MSAQQSTGNEMPGEMSRQPQPQSDGRSPLAAVRELVGEQVSKASEQARGFINERVSSGKKMACDELSHAVAALRAGADKLRGEQGDRLAGYADAIANWAERGAGYLREHDLAELAEPARGAVRNRPALALGGLFIAGVALGRFLKASSDQQEIGEGQYDQATAGWAPESGEPDRARSEAHWGAAEEAGTAI